MNSITLRDPDALVTTSWLAAHLGDPDLRIFDCTTRLVGDKEKKRPYIVEPCLHEYEAGHIPGAGHLDLQRDFSLQDSPFAMTLADPIHVAAAFEKNGIDHSSKVILYSRRGASWSARFWWMLKWLGFDNASILDGGHEKWEAENRALSRSPCKYPAGILQIQPRPELFVGKQEVLSAISDRSICLISALGADVYSGKSGSFARPGRIPRSVNVPQKSLLVDPAKGFFKPAGEISQYFVEAGAAEAKGFIAYCGSGIFAAVDAFWLYQLGYDNVAVYDNSMSEWAADVTLPMECDWNTAV